MKLLAYYDEDKGGKAHYVNVSQTVYDAVLHDILGETRAKLIMSCEPFFYKFSLTHRRLLGVYEYLLNFRNKK